MINPMKFQTHSEREEEAAAAVADGGGGGGGGEEQEQGGGQEGEEESIPVEEDDQMTLAQISQSMQTPTPNLLKAVVADKINKSENKSCKRRVSFANSVDVTASKRRAIEIQQSLNPELPSFVKHMLRSHVTHGFWLGLPTAFADSYLPKHDLEMTLVDENGEEWMVKYIFYRNGLSGGWRGFSIAKKLVEGDTLVFQLIKPTQFKVHIVRAQALPEDVEARNVLQLEDEFIPSTGSGKANKSSGKRRLPIPHRKSKKKNTKGSPPISSPSLGLAVGQHPESGNEEVVVDSEVLAEIRFSGSNVEFKDVTIMVDGLIIDSEIADEVRSKYFDLCCSKNDFIHKNLLKGFNCKLVAGIITEIVNIADAIRATKLSTPHNEYNRLLDSLKGLEKLGMSVGFLRARLEQLAELAFKSEESMEFRKYKEAITERARVEDNIKSLEGYILKLKKESFRLEMEIGTLKEKAEKHELNFQAEVNAPW